MKNILLLSIIFVVGCASSQKKPSYVDDMSSDELLKERERMAQMAERDMIARADMERLRISSMTMDNLCTAHRKEPNNSNKYFNEIQRRAGFVVADLEFIALKQINLGISEMGLKCSFGKPEKIEVLPFPLRITRYIYKKGFVDFKSDVAVNIQRIINDKQ